MYKNKFAIILVNYNGFEDTKACIESIYKMKCEDKTDIFVVDNASNRNEAESLKNIFPNIKIIVSRINLGFAGGNNLAIKEAVNEGYKAVLLLNNDTVVDSDLLSQLLKEYDENTILAPKMLYYSLPSVIWYAGGSINKKTGNAIHFKMDENDDGDVSTKMCSFTTGCCMLIPVNVIKKIGVLDESYFMYCEDTEYCLRALKNKIGIKYVPSAKLWHKVSQSTGGDQSMFSIYYMTRNRFRYLKDYSEYFNKGAFAFSVVSRYIRCMQFALKGKKSYKAFLMGMSDFRKNRFGERKL